MHYMLLAPKRTAPNPVPVKIIEFVINFNLGKNLWTYTIGGRKRRPDARPYKTLWNSRKA